MADSKKYTFSSLPEDKRWLLRDPDFFSYVALNSLEAGEITEEKLDSLMSDYGFEKKGHNYIAKPDDSFINILHELGSSAFNDLTGERDIIENQKNRDFQSEQAEIARAWEVEQAKVAREWDSIGARMERAAAAGVNPISVAMSEGGFGTSGTSSVPSSPGVPMGSSGLMHNGVLDIASTVFQGIGTLAEQRLKQSQADDIVIMRKFNIAEKIATTDHLRQMDSDIELSKVAQTIQNQWLDRLNQATFDSMYNEMGYRDAMSEQARSVVNLNLQQIDSIKQDMYLNLQRFNATLPLELQLMESELDFKNASVQQIYTEICMRHLQTIEQESRNVQAAAEAESAQTASNLAKATYEDAISSFHNDMVRGAAEAGISLYDYQYYGTSASTWPEYVSKGIGGFIRPFQKKRNTRIHSSNIQGLE